MLSGIMAIFEMGLAVTGQSLIPSPVDAYLTNPNVKSMDRALLNLLSNPAPVVPGGLDGTDLCNAIRLVYQANYSFPAQQFSLEEDDLRSFVGTAWQDSCVMDDGNHRVLIKPEGSSYKFYSCVIDDRDRCSFEQGAKG